MLPAHGHHDIHNQKMSVKMSSKEKGKIEQDVLGDNTKQIQHTAPARLGMETYLIRHGTRYNKPHTAFRSVLIKGRRIRPKNHKERHIPFESASGDVFDDGQLRREHLLVLPLQIHDAYQPVHGIRARAQPENIGGFGQHTDQQDCPRCVMDEGAFLCLGIVWIVSMLAALFVVNRATGFPATLMRFWHAERRR